MFTCTVMSMNMICFRVSTEFSDHECISLVLCAEILLLLCWILSPVFLHIFQECNTDLQVLQHCAHLLKHYSPVLVTSSISALVVYIYQLDLHLLYCLQPLPRILDVPSYYCNIKLEVVLTAENSVCII